VFATVPKGVRTRSRWGEGGATSLALAGRRPKEGMPGEKGLRPAAATSTTVVEGQPDTVSAVAEPGTKIPCL